MWSLGSNVSETLLDFGQRRAVLLQARARPTMPRWRATARPYSAPSSRWRTTSPPCAILGQEAQVQDAAVTEAADAARIAENEYKAGTVDYTTVVTAQVAELTDRECRRSRSCRAALRTP